MKFDKTVSNILNEIHCWKGYKKIGLKKKNGKMVGFTSGAFDLMHAGHADYLEKAKALCDALVVAMIPIIVSSLPSTLLQYKAVLLPKSATITRSLKRLLLTKKLWLSG